MDTDPRELVTPAEYVAERPKIFASTHAWNWFARQHRQELATKGALVMPTGRQLIDPPVCDKVVAEIGRRLATERTYTPRTKTEE